MLNSVASRYRRFAILLCCLFMTGCGYLNQQLAALGTRPPEASHRFVFDPSRQTVVGKTQLVRASEGDTLSDIARRFNLGYEEIVRANPGVDPWLPRAGTDIVLPTRHVLPDAGYRGVVINLAALRLYYFPPPGEDGLQTVITHPIGIGRVGWRTPEGATTVIAKKTDPTWFPPVSIRREHAANGDPLPARVPPGPDNPLGRHMFRLGWTSYLIHGTNRPYGVGLRASHGCIRMYPEDIALLYDDIPVGTPVTIVNQPQVYGWRDGTLYLQAFPVLEDDRRDHAARAPELLAGALEARPAAAPAVMDSLIAMYLEQRRGIALPVSDGAPALERHLAGALRVENRLPLAASWDGVDEVPNEQAPP